MNLRGFLTAAALAAVAMTVPLHSQNFGAAKTKVVLQRKLPALMTLSGDTIRVRVTGYPNFPNLAPSLQSQLETELLKDDPNLREEETNPATIVTCQITNVAAPQRTVTQRPNLMAGKNGPKTLPYVRITASLSVSFQAKTRSGHMLGSDNVTVNYDQEFDSSGNNASHGIMGSMTSSWHKIKGGSSDNQDDQPPDDSELRDKLLTMAVHRMAEQIVNTNESIEVFLAKGKGPIDEGDKQAEAGLWERALETFETAPPMNKQEEDAYRLYDIGVADEALGYAAADPKSAMKFLDQAAINYGKAIDAKPGEKYFMEPQKRIETAIAHYRKLEDQKAAPAAATVAENTPPPKPGDVPAPAPAPVREHHAAASAPRQHEVGHTRTVTHSLTNAQVVAMVKAGMDDDTIARTVRTSGSVDFDLSFEAQHALTRDGVSHVVLTAMKERAARELATGQ